MSAQQTKGFAASAKRTLVEITNGILGTVLTVLFLKRRICYHLKLGTRNSQLFLSRIRTGNKPALSKKENEGDGSYRSFFAKVINYKKLVIFTVVHILLIIL